MIYREIGGGETVLHLKPGPYYNNNILFVIQAVHYYKRAASHGHACSLYNLGVLHLEGGGGLDKSLLKATHCFTRAAEAGLAAAQRELAIIYAQHHPKKVTSAVEWFQKAAKQKVVFQYSNFNLIEIIL